MDKFEQERHMFGCSRLPPRDFASPGECVRQKCGWEFFLRSTCIERWEALITRGESGKDAELRKKSEPSAGQALVL